MDDYPPKCLAILSIALKPPKQLENNSSKPKALFEAAEPPSIPLANENINSVGLTLPDLISCVVKLIPKPDIAPAKGLTPSNPPAAP